MPLSSHFGTPTGPSSTRAATSSKQHLSPPPKLPSARTAAMVFKPFGSNDIHRVPLLAATPKVSPARPPDIKVTVPVWNHPFTTLSQEPSLERLRNLHPSRHRRGSHRVPA